MSMTVCLVWMSERVLGRVCHENHRVKWQRQSTWAFASLMLLALTPVAHADSISYAYDAVGRLIQATDSTTQQAIIYTYDSVGNIVSEQAVSLTTLAVSGFSADQGAPGSQITIDGTGFSSSSTVTINGVAATVVSATSTQLVVDIPSGATSGAITVATGSTTVTSSATFTVAAGDAGPTITSFSPTLGGVGTSVSISGTGFSSATSSNEVSFGGSSWASANTASGAAIITTTPNDVWSGKVQVLAPAGTAISSTDFFVPPSGYTVATIGSTGRIAANTPATISLPTAGSASLQIFDGTAGALLTVGIGSVSITSCTVKVFAPTGALLTSSTVTASTQGIQLPALPETGTYAIVIDPGSNTGSLVMTLVTPIQASMSIGGASVPRSEELV